VNLLDNAAKYSPPGTTIYIGAKKTDGGVRFYVEDEGPGIPQSKRDSIFERFHRSNGTAGGLGLGLAIVRGIIEGHGGRIWVESGRKGARFVFDLPVNSDERQKEDTGRR
jgi:two-component system sensor histidine kinase KdpD